MNRVDEGASGLNSHTYLAQTVVGLWENLPQFLLGGIFFSLISAPAFVLAVLGMRWLALVVGLISVAPAWTALLAFEAELAQGRSVGLTQLPARFRRVWLPSVRLALIAVLPALAVAMGTQFLTQVDATLSFGLGVFGGLLGLLVAIVILLYASPLVALYDSAASSALRNSFVLSARHIANTLGLTAMAVLMMLAAVYFSLGLILIWPPIYGLFVVNNCRLVWEMER